MTINAAHRRHYKSGACLQSDPWATSKQIEARSSKFAQTVAWARHLAGNEDAATPEALALDPELPKKRGFFQTMKDWLFPRTHAATQ